MMSRNALDEAIRTFRKKEPFEPFVIECDDGRRFIVRDPKAIDCMYGSATYVRPDGNFDFLDFEIVSRVVPLTEPTPA
jgi:hypothetical protein